MKISRKGRAQDIEIYSEILEAVKSGSLDYKERDLKDDFRSYKRYFGFHRFLNRWTGILAVVIFFGTYYLNEMLSANVALRTLLLLIFLAAGILIFFFKRMERRAENYRVNALIVRARNE